MWLNVPIFLVLATAGAIIYGRLRWKAETRGMRDRLRALRAPAMQPSQDLDIVPEPVRRFLRAALPPNPPIITTVLLTHEGTFNLSETGQQWKPFQSTQIVIADRPGFDWDARIAMVPGVDAFVHDAYIGGTGILHVEALGLIPIADELGKPELAKGELERFLAEAAWYPTRLLPGPNLQWEAVDAESAKAMLRDGANSATIIFHFNPYGLIDKVSTPGRFRISGGVAKATPWEGNFWAYEERDGMKIPTEGEVSWLLPDGRLPYWRGRLTGIRYEFAESPAAYRRNSVAA